MLSSDAMQGRDTLADVRSAVYYFENIAEDDGDDARRGMLADTVVKLGKIITHIEDEVKRTYVDCVMSIHSNLVDY